MRWLFTTFSWLFSQRGPWLPRLRGPLKGFWIRPASEPVAHASDLVLQNQSASQLARVCQKGWTVWDCGTGIGYSTLLFSKFVGETGAVVAFEPDRRNFMRTYDNATLNGCFNIFFVCAAVAARKSPAYPAREFTLAQAFSNSEFPRPQLIRLDGNDLVGSALREAKLTHRGDAPVLVLEFKKGCRVPELWQFAAENGYLITSVDEDRPLPEPTLVRGTVLLTR